MDKYNTLLLLLCFAKIISYYLLPTYLPTYLPYSQTNMAMTICSSNFFLIHIKFLEYITPDFITHILHVLKHIEPPLPGGFLVPPNTHSQIYTHILYKYLQLIYLSQGIRVSF